MKKLMVVIVVLVLVVVGVTVALGVTSTKLHNANTALAQSETQVNSLQTQVVSLQGTVNSGSQEIADLKKANERESRMASDLASALFESVPSDKSFDGMNKRSRITVSPEYGYVNYQERLFGTVFQLRSPRYGNTILVPENPFK